MEATGIHNFQANAGDELSFTKGEKLRIVSKEDSDPNWYKAEYMGKTYLVPSNYVNMDDHSWYRGRMSRMQAEGELANRHEGAYIIRNSESGFPADGQSVPFSLSVKTALGFEHFRIMNDENGKYFLWTKKFDFINQLVQHHRSESVSRKTNVVLRDNHQIPTQPQQPAPPPIRRGQPLPPVLPSGPPKPMAPPAPPPVHRVQAIYAYMPEDPHDGISLTLQAGDIITVIEKTDQNWWKGNLNGRIGFFPASYIKNC